MTHAWHNFSFGWYFRLHILEFTYKSRLTGAPPSENGYETEHDVGVQLKYKTKWSVDGAACHFQLTYVVRIATSSENQMKKYASREKHQSRDKNQDKERI